MNVELVMFHKGQRQRAIPLKAKETVIGRQKGCAIRIASHEVSRLHCCLRLQDDKVTVRDLGSANGTFVNGQQVKGEQVLKHGDKLQLSDLTFVVEYEQGQELIAGVPVEEFEFVEEVVEGVILLDEEQPTVKPQPRPAAAGQIARQAPPSPPPGFEEVLPDAQVEESEFRPAGSEPLPAAEVEESTTQVTPPTAPAAAAEDVPFADLEEPEPEVDWVPPWEEKPKK
jgi:pSer/pThr/pTyr-binding forkhead associated (FHA) protein